MIPRFLAGKKVYLAPHRLDDAEKYMRWINDPEVNRYLENRYMFNMENELEFLRKAHQPPEKHFFAIHRLEDDALIGAESLVRVNPVHKTAVFGIFIGDKTCWGKGYGTEATQLLVKYAFHSLNLHRVELDVFAFNQRAIGAYEKAGFRREGLAREAIFVNGQYEDVVKMGILASDLKP